MKSRDNTKLPRGNSVDWGFEFDGRCVRDFSSSKFSESSWHHSFCHLAIHRCVDSLERISRSWKHLTLF